VILSGAAASGAADMSAAARIFGSYFMAWTDGGVVFQYEE
jgi:hypothetical protein